MERTASYGRTSAEPQRWFLRSFCLQGNFAVPRHPKVFAAPVGESFDQTFSKVCAGGGRGGLLALRRGRNTPKRRFFFDNFFLCASGFKEKSGYGLRTRKMSVATRAPSVSHALDSSRFAEQIFGEEPCLGSVRFFFMLSSPSGCE